ncbi:hypothetical protein B617_gp50 [Nonlabens phage P12024S]|nr:hypothetical protein B617_gp50 [Nonlabens phage P12024S]AFM54711.1 hypothetical protein P12024S_50 [Nonlabens phage P12024S]
MANKTITIKGSEKMLQVLKVMKELKDLRRDNAILKFKNDKLTEKLNLCGVVKSDCLHDVNKRYWFKNESKCLDCGEYIY